MARNEDSNERGRDSEGRFTGDSDSSSSMKGGMKSGGSQASGSGGAQGRARDEEGRFTSSKSSGKSSDSSSRKGSDSSSKR